MRVRRADSKPFAGCYVMLAACMLLAACAGKAPVPSPAASQARTATERGAQAFARGDLASAERDYRRALLVHESLGDIAARSSVLLSLARIAAEAGRPADAMAAVQQVLADQALLPADTRVTAHGRAAALHLGMAETMLADQQLALAAALCVARCADAAALTVLAARSALIQQQPGKALQLAGEALAMPALLAASSPALPGNNPLASAERANALRVQAQAQLGLGQAQAAATAAAEALALDQALGLADRALADLELLSLAHQAAGNSTQAGHYKILAMRAQAARRALRGALPGD